MRVEVVSHLRPAVAEADRVVIYDSHGNPIVVAVQISESVIITSKLGDADFHHTLVSMGINKTVVVGVCRPPKVSDFDL